jgi:hypothetical protein
MTPEGFLTIPDALKILHDRIGEDDLLMQKNPKRDRMSAAGESLWFALWDGQLKPYILQGGAVMKLGRGPDDYDLAVGRDPWDKSRETGELLKEWRTWFLSGRVANGGRYNGCRVFIRTSELEDWMCAAPGIEHIYKTGAPGRPTSMQLVEQEHTRRVCAGETAPSIKAEARYLEKWRKDTHPAAPRLTAKTIENKLRETGFRPKSKRDPK